LKLALIEHPLTNLSDIEKISEAVQEGAYEYLIKTDWKIEDIIKKVKEKLAGE